MAPSTFCAAAAAGAAGVVAVRSAGQLRRGRIIATRMGVKGVGVGVTGEKEQRLLLRLRRRRLNSPNQWAQLR